MNLSTYISESIYSVMNGLKNADIKLNDEKLGRIWNADFSTLARDLVQVRLAKGKDPQNGKSSVPIMLFDYDVNITIQDDKGSE